MGLLSLLIWMPIATGVAILILGDKSIAAQTRRVLENLQEIVSAAGGSMADIVKTTVFLKDMKDFAEMNSAYSEFFTSAPPARATVEVSRLPKDASVEIDCIALLA